MPTAAIAANPSQWSQDQRVDQPRHIGSAARQKVDGPGVVAQDGDATDCVDAAARSAAAQALQVDSIPQDVECDAANARAHQHNGEKNEGILQHLRWDERDEGSGR